MVLVPLPGNKDRVLGGMWEFLDLGTNRRDASDLRLQLINNCPGGHRRGKSVWRGWMKDFHCKWLADGARAKVRGPELVCAQQSHCGRAPKCL